MGFFERLQAKLELYRLEQRYTRRDKRTTFVTDAQYVDGEYITSSPTSPTTSSSSNASRRLSKIPSVRVKEFRRSPTVRV